MQTSPVCGPCGKRQFPFLFVNLLGGACYGCPPWRLASMAFEKIQSYGWKGEAMPKNGGMK